MNYGKYVIMVNQLSVTIHERVEGQEQAKTIENKSFKSKEELEAFVTEFLKGKTSITRIG